MKIVVFGASRGVGRCLVERALALGHDVTAASRNPLVSVAPHSRLRFIRCDVRDTPAVCDVLAGQDVVFGALGSGSRGATDLYSAGARSILKGMNARGIRRLVFLSNFGVLGERGCGWSQKALLMLASPMLRHTLADHRLALDAIRQAAPEWVAVRPLPLTDSCGTGQYRVSVDDLPPGGTRISRADVADFMLRQVTDTRYLGAAPAISY
jgi:putative NADH-flavin reductase